MMVESEVVDAFAQLGVQVRTSGTHEADLVIEPGGMRIQVKTRSLVDEDIARRLLVDARPDGSTLIIVGDRVTASARSFLTAAGAGYLDRRGHLALRAGFYVIDADVTSAHASKSARKPLAGKSGLEIATHMLMHPEERASVRDLARRLDRSPSTVSDELQSLQAAGLLDEHRQVRDDSLFWEVALHWSNRPVYLKEVPPQSPSDALARSLRVEAAEPRNEGWALTGSRAALAYEAPIAMKDDDRLDLYVQDGQAVNRAITLLGEAKNAADAACSIRLAPVPAVCRNRVAELPGSRGWSLAHPLFVALDLAQDRGRGREILHDWNPEPRWQRVW